MARPLSAKEKNAARVAAHESADMDRVSADPTAQPFDYRLLTELDQEEALLIKVKALEVEHYSLSQGFTLGGVAGPPLPGEDPIVDGEKQLERFRQDKKRRIETQLAALHTRVDEVRERAKKNGRPLLEEARANDAEITRRMTASQSPRVERVVSGGALLGDPFQVERRAARAIAREQKQAERQVRATPGIVRDGDGNIVSTDPHAAGSNTNPTSGGPEGS